MSSVSLSSETLEIAILGLLHFSKSSESTESQTPSEKIPMSQAEGQNFTNKVPTSSVEIFTINKAEKFNKESLELTGLMMMDVV